MGRGEDPELIGGRVAYGHYGDQDSIMNSKITLWQSVAMSILTAVITLLVWLAITFIFGAAWWQETVLGNRILGTIVTRNHVAARTSTYDTTNTTFFPNGLYPVENTIGFVLNNHKTNGVERKQNSPRFQALTQFTNGSHLGDTGVEVLLTCGSNSSRIGDELSVLRLTCDGGAIISNSSGFFFPGDVTIGGNLNFTSSTVKFQGVDVLTHGVDPYTGVDTVLIGAGFKPTTYRGSYNNFVNVVNVSSSVTASGYISSDLGFKYRDKVIISVSNGQILLGNSTTGTYFPSDFRGLAKQGFATDANGVGAWVDEPSRVRKSSASTHTRTNVGSDTTTEVAVLVLESAATTKTWCRVAFFGVTPTISAKFEFRDSANTLVATTSVAAITAGFGTQDCSSFPAAGVGGTVRVDMVTSGFSAGTVRAEAVELKYLA